MTRVLITGFPDGKKIQAIKGLRAATGMGLKQAKEVIERVPTEIEMANEYVRYLNGYVEYKVQGPSLHDLVAALEQYPRAISVGDLVDVLVAAVNGKRP